MGILYKKGKPTKVVLNMKLKRKLYKEDLHQDRKKVANMSCRRKQHGDLSFGKETGIF
jgi:hypothetical protein